MPEDQPLLLSELLAQAEPKAEDVVATLRYYPEHGMFMQKSDVETLIEKTKLDAVDLTLIYQSIVNGARDETIAGSTKQGYGDIAMYIQGKIDEINPRPEPRPKEPGKGSA